MATLRFTPKTLAISDPREMPIYSIPLTAHYLRLPVATLRSWVSGRDYPVQKDSRRRFRPLLELPDPKAHLLSFNNLAEAHVLAAFRRKHRIPLASIRRALDFLKQEYGQVHPLLEERFETDGISLFVSRLGKLIDVSQAGQLAMREVVITFLQRLEREDGAVVRLFPFTRANLEDSPRMVFMDPRFSFGRPVVSRKRVPTSILAERYQAGDSIDDLATDYGCPRLEIEEGIRCEFDLKAA